MSATFGWSIRPEPSLSAQIAYIVTPAGIVLSILLLGEQPSTFIWLALVILLISLFLVQPRQKATTQTN